MKSFVRGWRQTLLLTAVAIVLGAQGLWARTDITTQIKDVEFRAWVYYKIGKTAPDAIFDTDVETITFVDVFRGGISDLSGIEYFKALQGLNCDFNSLIVLDVSKNTSLQLLSCGWNQLTKIDVSKNTVLSSLSCQGNKLSTLDVSKNSALKLLNCAGNSLTSLDVSKNAMLEDLQCSENKMNTLDVSKNITLNSLRCNSNLLTTLDVSRNTALKSLECWDNELTALDVSKNVVLKDLRVYNNYLKSENDIIGLNKSKLSTFYFNPQKTQTSILSSNISIPIPSNSPMEAMLISPIDAAHEVITVGPNPAFGHLGKMYFFYTGSRILSGSLSIYDACGTIVRWIDIHDEPNVGNNVRREVCSWNLTDAKGHRVYKGTYLIRGMLKTYNGKYEGVSLVVGVR